MTTEWALPSRQKYIGPISDYSPTHSWALRKLAQEVGLDPERVSKVCDLGCGVGYLTQALLDAFPFSQVDAVDYHDILDPIVKSNPRVRFHQSLLVNAAKSGRLGFPEITLLTNITHTHGFNHNNIESLEKLVKLGILITGGDNHTLEESFYFRRRFRACTNEGWAFWAFVVWKTSP